jgi:hypothetical protein
MVEKKRAVGRTIALTGGAILALVIGLTGGQAIASVLGNSEGGSSREEYASTLPPIQVNESGQSYGSEAHASSPEELPDLILVLGDSGRDGYVYAKDLHQAAPASPEEAVRFQNSGEVVLDVYLSDGVTKVDTFTIGG